MIDNNYIAGSSTPINRIDREGNSYQNRKLSDGFQDEVLKNFPVEDELRNAVQQKGKHIKIFYYTYYGLLQYILA